MAGSWAKRLRGAFHQPRLPSLSELSCVAGAKGPVGGAQRGVRLIWHPARSSVLRLGQDPSSLSRVKRCGQLVANYL